MSARRSSVTSVVPIGARIDPKAPLDAARHFRSGYKIGEFPGLHFRQGEFYAWAGSHYIATPDEAMRSQVYGWLSSCRTENGTLIAPNRRLVTDILDALKGEAYATVSSAPDWLDGHTGAPINELLVCQNGIVHLPTRSLRRADPRLFATAALSLDFDPQAPHPTRWLAFLDTVFPSDPESIELLQEYIGLCALTDDTRHQKALLIVGPRRSGKGTILRIARELAGYDNVCSPTFASLGTSFGLQGLIGKRMAQVSDARLSSRTDIALVVESILRITGEDAISVPRKHREDFVGKLPTRFVVATNELPSMADASAALSSRFVILRMVRSFYGAEDHDLTANLIEELPGILLWALDGLDRLRARGRLVQPATSQELVDELEALSSPVGMFIRECCIIDPAGETQISALFDRWCDWCRDQGRDHPGTAADFGKKLRASIPAISSTRPWRNGIKVRCYSGVRLRSIMDLDSDSPGDGPRGPRWTTVQSTARVSPDSTDSAARNGVDHGPAMSTRSNLPEF